MEYIISKLLLYIDGSKEKDIYYNLAYEILKNVKKIEKLNITELADLCFVSTATISRFCRKIGYENFSDFKRVLKSSHRFEEDYTKELLNTAKNNLKSTVVEYNNSVTENINALTEELDTEVVDRILKVIHESDKVAFFGLQFLQFLAIHLQTRLLLMGKSTFAFLSQEEQLKCAEELDENSIAIILSLGGGFGRYAEDTWNMLVERKTKIILITQNPNNRLREYASHVLLIPGDNKHNSGKVTMLSLIEILSIRYYGLYKK